MMTSASVSQDGVADPIIHLRPERPEPLSLDALVSPTGIDVRAGNPAGIAITGATIATDNVRPGDLWVGLPGAHSHGASYARQAVDLGALAVLTDEAGFALLEEEGSLSPDVPVLVRDDLRTHLGDVSRLVYGTDQPGGPKLLGVTGTNGKTSTVHMLRGILEHLSISSAISSTVERRLGDEHLVSGLTTPESPDLHALIALMREREIAVASLEVSAQAVTRHRVDGLRFDVVGFTNLSHDHLDDYGDMETYFREKAALFTPEHAARGVVSFESPWGARLVEAAKIPITTIGRVNVDAAPNPPAATATATATTTADWLITIGETTCAGTEFTLVSPDGHTFETRSPVPGEHMAYNMAVAIVMLVESGEDVATLASVLTRDTRLPSIPGRIENIAGPGAPEVFVDFGHSADAFRLTLRAIRSLTPGRVFMVFGADGDRDATKRADMATEAVLGSDVLVVTDHHPRFEDPASIRRTLAQAALDARPDAELHVVSPPPRAIRLAVALARPGDAILWAGPGHQNYREIRGVKTRYSARDEARAALRDAGYAVLEA